MGALPGDRAPHGLVNIYTLGVAQFLADAARIDHDVLLGVDTPAQRFGQATVGDAHDTAMPPGSISNLLHPFGHREGKWLADIVNATGGALVCHSQYNSISNVL